MIKKLILGLMWFLIIFIMSYVGTGVILLLLILAPETNQIKYEAAQTFRNTYMIFFIIGSLIIAILGTVTNILPGTKKKHSAKKKMTTKKKTGKKASGKMKRAVCILIFVISCILISLPSAHSQKDVESFSIQYNHAGLREIEIKDGQLHHVWHSLRHFGEGEPMVMRQDLSSYDRYEAHIWLTQQELKRFQEWITKHKVFRFKPFYESASEGRSYGAAFKTSLAIMRGDKNHAITWAGDSKVPDRLKKAVDQLIKFSEEIQTSRKEKGLL